MKVKNFLLILISSMIMLTAFFTGITGVQGSEDEQLFRNQAIQIDEVDEHLKDSKGNDILSLFHPMVLLISLSVILILFSFCVILAKKNGLYFISEKKQHEKLKQKEQYIGDTLQKELQYDN